MDRSIFSWLIAAALSMFLVGCGGGGGGAQETSPAPTPTPDKPLTTLPPVPGMIGLGENYFPARPDYSPENLHVDFYGDSILLGVGVEFSPVKRIMQARPGWIIDHHYAGGLSASNVFNGYDFNTPYLDAKYMPFGPQPPFMGIKRTAQVVVLEFGYNDAFRNELDFYYYLHQMVYQVKREGRIPVLTGVFKSEMPVELQQKYDALTKRVAEETLTEHADWGQITLLNGGSGADTIHRTQRNSDELAAVLLGTIERALINATYGRH